MTNTMWSSIEAFLPFLIPVIAIQLILMVIALVDLSKQKQTRGPKLLWWLVIPFVNIIGPILYFVIGRKDE